MNAQWQRNTSATATATATATAHRIAAAGVRVPRLWRVDPAVVPHKPVVDAGGLRPGRSVRRGASGGGGRRRPSDVAGWWCGALPHHQLGGELDAQGRRVRVVRSQQHLRRLLGHLPQWLMDGRQGRARPLGERDVVVTHHGQVPRNAQPLEARRLQDPERLQIAAGEDGGGPVRCFEQFHGVREAALDVEVSVPHETGVGFKAAMAMAER